METENDWLRAIAVLNTVCPDRDLGSHEGRIVAQKVIYLCQELGVQIGYDDYGWTIRGVYSQNLNKDIFRAIEGLRLARSKQGEP